MENDELLLYSICLILSILGSLFKYIRGAMRNKAIRADVFAQKLIHYQEFEDNWIVQKQGNKGIAGYKYNDTSGCYVIFIYNEYAADDALEAYEDIYIGQSIHICQRVHNHFNGKGNGDVYADIKYGKQVYVQFIPCAAKQMNALEKKLIRAFRADTSYNATKGGAMAR